jgi:hypothetical protein
VDFVTHHANIFRPRHDEQEFKVRPLPRSDQRRKLAITVHRSAAGSSQEVAVGPRRLAADEPVTVGGTNTSKQALLEPVIAKTLRPSGRRPFAA